MTKAQYPPHVTTHLAVEHTLAYFVRDSKCVKPTLKFTLYYVHPPCTLCPTSLSNTQCVAVGRVRLNNPPSIYTYLYIPGAGSIFHRPSTSFSSGTNLSSCVTIVYSLPSCLVHHLYRMSSGLSSWLRHWFPLPPARLLSNNRRGTLRLSSSTVARTQPPPRLARVPRRPTSPAVAPGAETGSPVNYDSMSSARMPLSPTRTAPTSTMWRRSTPWTVSHLYPDQADDKQTIPDLQLTLPQSMLSRPTSRPS